jgi:hypothetical protein
MTLSYNFKSLITVIYCSLIFKLLIIYVIRVVYRSPRWEFDRLLLFPINCLVCVCECMSVKTHPRYIGVMPYIGSILHHLTVGRFQSLSSGWELWYLMSCMCIHDTLFRAWAFMALNVVSGYLWRFISRLSCRDG